MASPDVMHRSMGTVHAANICMWLKRDLKFDPVKEQFIDDAEANRYLTRPSGSRGSIEVRRVVETPNTLSPPETHPMIRRMKRLGCLALFSSCLFATGDSQAAPPSGKEKEQKLIAVIKSDAPLKDKADACRELSLVGTKDSVGPLAAFWEMRRCLIWRGTGSSRFPIRPST